MALLSFIIPTEKDILKDLDEKPHAIKFIGLGNFSQTIDEIKFSRTFKYRFDKESTLNQVIYFRKGLIWKFKKVIPLQKQVIVK